ncbi:e3 ubiquitin-protein ligase RNF13 [Trichonephila clavipes]|nr:e3 ubiquitin-protein ligase RNF13 [Trichonephila clavipes]
MTAHTITLAVGAVCRIKAKSGLRRSSRGLHTRTPLLSLLRLNLDSSLKMTSFLYAAVQFPRVRHHSKRWRQRQPMEWAASFPNFLQPSAFVWFEKTSGPLVKALPVPGRQSKKQLAILLHFLQNGRLLNDWSDKSVLSRVFV